MLCDVPRSTVLQHHYMLRVDLDGTDFTLSGQGLPNQVVHHKLYLWAGPTQIRKEITPMLVKLVEVKSAATAGRDAQKQAGDHFAHELRAIADKVNSAIFKRAADLFEQNREAIIQMVADAHARAGEAFKAHKKAEREALKTGTLLPPFTGYQRASFHLDGVALQDTPDYATYWEEVYEKARQDKGCRQVTSDGVAMRVISNAPCKWRGGVLGTNIPVEDKEYVRWGYKQNTGMWMSEQEFVERTAGMDEVPRYEVVIGKVRVHVALLSPSRAGGATHLGQGLALALEGVDDGGAWLPQHLRPFWTNEGSTSPAPLAEDLRLAIFTTERVRVRLLAYEPLSESRLVQSIARFQRCYPKRTIYHLAACQQAPKEDPHVTPPDIRAWVRRIFTGAPATLQEATRALTRWLIESRSNQFRVRSQTLIMEDYMSSAPLDTQYASLGAFMSACADIAFQTGQLSFQNKEGNAYAHARKERFLSRFLTVATRTPTAAVALVSQEINRFLGAIPAIHAHKGHFLRHRFNQALLDVAVVTGAPTHHQQVSVWKGFTDHQHQLTLERVERCQAQGQTQGTTPSESSN